MDIERTMEFILSNLAAVTASQQQAEVRAQQADLRAARTDRQIRGLQTLVKIGMRQLVKHDGRLAKLDLRLAKLQERTDARFAEMAIALKESAAQHKRTDQKFERWLDSLKGGNGHLRGSK